jgi:hypothetical protein
VAPLLAFPEFRTVALGVKRQRRTDRRANLFRIH